MHTTSQRQNVLRSEKLKVACFHSSLFEDYEYLGRSLAQVLPNSVLRKRRPNFVSVFGAKTGIFLFFSVLFFTRKRLSHFRCYFTCRSKIGVSALKMTKVN